MKPNSTTTGEARPEPGAARRAAQEAKARKHALAGQPYVVTARGRILPASEYDPNRLDILVEAA